MSEKLPELLSATESVPVTVSGWVEVILFESEISLSELVVSSANVTLFFFCLLSLLSLIDARMETGGGSVDWGGSGSVFVLESASDFTGVTTSAS